MGRRLRILALRWAERRLGRDSRSLEAWRQSGRGGAQPESRAGWVQLLLKFSWRSLRARASPSRRRERRRIVERLRGSRRREELVLRPHSRRHLLIQSELLCPPLPCPSTAPNLLLVDLPTSPNSSAPATARGIALHGTFKLASPTSHKLGADAPAAVRLCYPRSTRSADAASARSSRPVRGLNTRSGGVESRRGVSDWSR